MIDTANQTPKLFVSYRWSTPKHEEWVLELASTLRGHGIDVLLDKWHLKEGQDTFKFMESMVNDETVTKVLLICDNGYVERANSRTGGVGTEAQIVSAQVYAKSRQDKFAAAVIDRDDGGNAILPTYMEGRLYFDFSEPTNYGATYKRVLRWCFGKPFHVAPIVGKPPSFLSETFVGNSSINLAASRLNSSTKLDSSRSIDSALNSLDVIEKASLELKLDIANDPEPDEKIYSTIQDSIPVLEQAFQAFDVIIVTMHIDQTVDTIHSFLENLCGESERFPERRTYSSISNDALRFFSHACLVGFIAICLKRRRFDIAANLLRIPFFVTQHNYVTGKSVDYTHFYNYLESINELRKRRLNLNRFSIHADILKDCFARIGVISFADFMEADFTLYMRYLCSIQSGKQVSAWYPVSCIYAAQSDGSFSTYARCASKAVFDRFAPILEVISADEVRAAVAIYNTMGQSRIRYSLDSLNVARLSNSELIATLA